MSSADGWPDGPERERWRLLEGERDVEGISRFDFGVGDEKYKDEFCDTVMSLYQAVIPASVAGAIFLSTHEVFERIHRRRVDSWREMDLAESACENPAESSPALAHARRS